MTATGIAHHVYGKGFGASAPENYERYFVPVIGGPLARDLIAAAALRPGERVLDVACGTGVIARLAAEAVAPNGTVAGLDLNAAMLAVARSLSDSIRPPIQWYESGAEAIPLPDAAFDVVLCQLGLQFFTDRVAALRQIRRVLVPNGRVLANVPGPSAFWDVFHDALARHAGAAAASFVRIVFSLHDTEEIRTLFERSDFDNVELRSYEKVVHLPAPEQFLWQYVQCTPLTAVMEHLDRDQLAALEREVVAGWQPWVDDGGLTYPQPMVIVSARASR